MWPRAAVCLRNERANKIDFKALDRHSHHSVAHATDAGCRKRRSAEGRTPAMSHPAECYRTADLWMHSSPRFGDTPQREVSPPRQMLALAIGRNRVAHPGVQMPAAERFTAHGPSSKSQGAHATYAICRTHASSYPVMVSPARAGPVLSRHAARIPMGWPPTELRVESQPPAPRTLDRAGAAIATFGLINHIVRRSCRWRWVRSVIAVKRCGDAARPGRGTVKTSPLARAPFSGRRPLERRRRDAADRDALATRMASPDRNADEAVMHARGVPAAGNVASLGRHPRKFAIANGTAPFRGISYEHGEIRGNEVSVAARAAIPLATRPVRRLFRWNVMGCEKHAVASQNSASNRHDWRQIVPSSNNP